MGREQLWGSDAGERDDSRPRWDGVDGVRFHHMTQNGAQVKTCELFNFWNFLFTICRPPLTTGSWNHGKRNCGLQRGGVGVILKADGYGGLPMSQAPSSVLQILSHLIFTIVLQSSYYDDAHWQTRKEKLRKAKKRAQRHIDRKWGPVLPNPYTESKSHALPNSYYSSFHDRHAKYYKCSRLPVSQHPRGLVDAW